MVTESRLSLAGHVADIDVSQPHLPANPSGRFQRRRRRGVAVQQFIGGVESAHMPGRIWAEFIEDERSDLA